MLIALALLLLADPPAAPALPVPPALIINGTLFIAPSGEPFRGKAGEPYPVATWFARADKDGDGKLTRAEFRRDALSFFPALDVNGDGVIDGKEITRYEEELVPEVRVSFAGGPQYRGTRTAALAEGSPTGSTRKEPDLPRGAGRYALINSPQPVVSVDTDFNRRITPQEMSAAADRRFTLLDPDGVGFLTLAGLPRTPTQKRAEARLKK